VRSLLLLAAGCASILEGDEFVDPIRGGPEPSNDVDRSIVLPQSPRLPATDLIPFLQPSRCEAVTSAAALLLEWAPAGDPIVRAVISQVPLQTQGMRIIGDSQSDVVWGWYSGFTSGGRDGQVPYGQGVGVDGAGEPTEGTTAPALEGGRFYFATVWSAAANGAVLRSSEERAFCVDRCPHDQALYLDAYCRPAAPGDPIPMQ
jgi:hypothetical protein